MGDAALAGAYVVFAIYVGVAIVGSLAFVRVFSDPHERERLPMAVCAVGLTLTLLTLLLVPIDIYNVSSTRDGAGDLTVSVEAIAKRNLAVKMLYYLFYSLIMFFAVYVIPFTYFYYEEEDEDSTPSKRAAGACKYTSFLIVIMTVLLIIGLVIKAPAAEHSDDSAQAYADNLLSAANAGDGAIGFCVAIITLIGFMCMITYTAYGMAAFPMALLRGSRAVHEEKHDVDGDLLTTEEQMRAIESKYLDGRQMSRKDKKQYLKIKREQRQLAAKQAKLTAKQDSYLHTILTCLRPFTMVFGAILCVVSALLIISLILTGVDRAINSTHGFVLVEPQIPNPFDQAMLAMSRAFPIDTVFFIATVSYFVVCTLVGVYRINIRFLWVNMYKVRPFDTVPQGLLLTCVILMLTLLALNQQMLTIAPEYASYGHQMYRTEDGPVQCSASAPTNATCTQTQIAAFINRIALKTPFFGTLFFFFNWAFIACFFIAIFIALVKGPASNIGDDSSDSEDL